MFQLIKTKVIVWLGGFPTIDSAIDDIQKKEREERKVILTLAVRRLFNTIGADDILKENAKGEWMMENKQIMDGTRDILKAEAEFLLKSKLWEILQRDIKYQANRKMFIIGKSEIDLITGKLWLFTLDALRTRLESISLGKGNFNSKNEG